MKQVYPIVLHPESEGGFSVSVPDLNIGTQGETVAECLDMARDAIGLWLSLIHISWWTTSRRTRVTGCGSLIGAICSHSASIATIEKQRWNRRKSAENGRSFEPFSHSRGRAVLRTLAQNLFRGGGGSESLWLSPGRTQACGCSHTCAHAGART